MRMTVFCKPESNQVRFVPTWLIGQANDSIDELLEIFDDTFAEAFEVTSIRKNCCDKDARCAWHGPQDPTIIKSIREQLNLIESTYISTTN